MALAEAVLDAGTVQLAGKMLEGGPFAHARATQLAERVLQDADRSYCEAQRLSHVRGGRG